MKTNVILKVAFLFFAMSLAGCEAIATTAPATTTAAEATTDTTDSTDTTEATTASSAAVMVTLHFETDGGTAVAPITQLSGSPVFEPAAPTKAGFAFAGWYEDAALTDDFAFTTMPGADMTLYADWGTAGLAYELLLSEDGYRVFADDVGAATAIIVPKRHLGLPVRELDDAAFAGLGQLVSVSLPDGITKIGYHAFYQCVGLTAITLPEGLNELGDAAFAYCAGLVEIVIPASVTELRQSLFSHCTALTGVTLPDTLTVIWDDAFAYCAALSAIVLPDGLTDLGAAVFQHCDALAEIVIPAGVTEILENTFSFCTGLTRVSLPATLISIEFSAFTNCSGLTNIVIPIAVVTMRYNVFHGCTSLTIFAEAGSQPAGWSETWNSGECPVFWAGAWTYVAGVPTPNP